MQIRVYLPRSWLVSCCRPWSRHVHCCWLLLAGHYTDKVKVSMAWHMMLLFCPMLPKFFASG